MKTNEAPRRQHSISFFILTWGIGIMLLLTGAIFFTTNFSFSRNTQEAVISQIKELSNQIVYNYENTINAMIETSNAMQIYIDKLDIREDSEQLSAYFSEVVGLRQEILNISVYDNITQTCMASSNPAEIGRTVAERDVWFFEASEEPNIHAFSVPYSDTWDENYKSNISKQIRYNRGGSTATLKIEISFDSFISLVEKTNFGSGGHITIIDPDYNLVYTSLLGTGTREELQIIRQQVLGTVQTKINGSSIVEELKLQPKQYFLVSAHREENIDNERHFLSLMTALN